MESQEKKEETVSQSYRQLANEFEALPHKNGNLSQEQIAIIEIVLKKAKTDKPGFLARGYIEDIKKWCPVGSKQDSQLAGIL